MRDSALNGIITKTVKGWQHNEVHLHRIFFTNIPTEYRKIRTRNISVFGHFSRSVSSVNNAVNVMKHPGSTTDDLVDYVRPVTGNKPDVIIMHVGTNDLTQGVNTMSKVIQEVDSPRNTQLYFSSIAQGADKNYSKEIKDINTRLKSYCLGKDLIFVDKSNIHESCLNNGKLHLSKKGTQLLSHNILRSLEGH